MRSHRQVTTRPEKNVRHLLGALGAVGFAAGLLLSAAAGGARAQVTETFVYDVHGRLTGAAEVNSTGTSSWSGYTFDTADNITVRSAATVNFPTTPSRLLEGEYLTLQQEITSPNGNVALTLKADGDLVVTCASTEIWSAGTAGTQALFLVVQPGDGHLVLYGPNYTPAVWFNGVWGYPGMFLQVQNDGNVVVYSSGNVVRWSTNRFCGAGGSEILPASFTASSNYMSYTGLTTPGGMKDGIFNTSDSIHGTNYGPTEIIQANLGTSQAVGRIDIASASASAPGGWGAVYTNGAAVEYSNDGFSWTSAGTVSGVVDNVYTSIPLGGATMQYIRLIRTSGYLGLGDFRVFGPGGGNLPPVAVNDTASVSSGGSVTINVLANDSDPDGDPLTVISASGATKGATSITTGGAAVLYTAGVGQSGTDTFTYTISDSRGGTAVAVVTVTITGGGGSEIIPVSFSTTSNYMSYTGLTTPGGMRDGNFYNTDSIHGTNGGAIEIIQANLGTSQTVSRIEIAAADASAPGSWGAFYLNGAAVEYSNDGFNWTSAGTVSGVVDGSYTSINFGGATMLYIRLIRTSGYLGMGDFRVYQ